MASNQNRILSTARATPRSFRWVTLLLYIGVIAAHLYYAGAGLCGPDLSLWRTGTLAGLVACMLALEVYEKKYFGARLTLTAALILLAVRMISFEVIATFDCAGFSKFLYLIAPFTAYFYFGKPVSYSLGVLYWIFLTAKLSMQDPYWTMNREYISVLLIFSIGVFFALSMAGVIDEEEASRARAEKLLGELEETHRELQSYAKQVAALAAAEERNRLARDIHDSLGHYLTIINIQLEKAMAFRQRDAQQADQALRDAKRSAQEALRDVRQSVGALRDSQKGFSLRAALSALKADLENESLTIDLLFEGNEGAFSKPVLSRLYRSAQEGLTNIHKHARATHAKVAVQLNGQEAHLQISDDGQGFDPADLNHLPVNRLDRFGLQGIRERIELAGGQMRVESSPGAGTQVFITIPKNPSTADGIEQGG